jgi:rhamnulokinase
VARFGAPAGVSCDSWAVDFGLLDEAGQLLEHPACYRDPRTDGMPQSFADIITPNALVRRVGAMALPIITLCQLRAMALTEPEKLAQARTLVHIADLMHYDLAGVAVTDRTMATASGLRNLEADAWDVDLLTRLGIPTHFLPEMVARPAVIGSVRDEYAPGSGLAGVPVVSTAGHDTAAASVLCTDDDHLFLSCGTWSMLGSLSREPLVTDTMATDMLETIAAARDRWTMMCPLTGLWQLQQCMLSWRRDGLAGSWDELIAATAELEGPVDALLDVGDAGLTVPVEMPEAIAAYCRRTGQPVPATPPEMARAVLYSLALEHRLGIETQRRVTRREFSGLRMVGGGTANRLLCQLTADAIGMPVIAGPTEATAAGNLLLQAEVLGLLTCDPAEVISASFAPVTYEPQEGIGDELLTRYRGLKGLS